MEFYKVDPSLENYWRSIILFGNNVASYKFALAKSLYELDKRPDDLVSLQELAVPFSRNLCEHLKHSPKQITAKSSQFLKACNQFNNNEISQDQLIDETVKRGFNNVITAFHTVNRESIEKQFFIDERKLNKGIRLTDNFFELTESEQYKNFSIETEARWRLVEEGWRLGVSRSLISVHYDDVAKTLYTSSKARRVDITSCRDSLNGYQKGHCFYCHTPVSVESGSSRLADVDHFFPWRLNDTISNVNGVWNLVLSCGECNRGIGGKSSKVPDISLLARLHRRNEYFINSHLPLRETLIQQTGKNEQQRVSFLQQQYQIAKTELIHEWKPKIRGVLTF
ncbi:HNH endonuclease family protein [Vibrio ulleungensis]|uniref:HNH endonuclease n=1 Tax=Vibrio ulleungensis TaxID=2807619 RepID=A0ABS2HL61_9VIBR|nr:HNH endonuclease domain-containing protein [Vibrio ulleungensis]MBM7037431.1 hypothetical protein [Vibrio ulleungensis]